MNKSKVQKENFTEDHSDASEGPWWQKVAPQVVSKRLQNSIKSVSINPVEGQQASDNIDKSRNIYTNYLYHVDPGSALLKIT